ncbi:acyltransferase [uncultured Psychroserpens sp.]|uniref:acyltransferase n=1 Tax=uncultured Psychroserpens sp. TaxID=255436 RepID=UPI0026248AC3|nr:acyltransferase [uncultured Psychroserpens sp.]
MIKRIAANLYMRLRKLIYSSFSNNTDVEGTYIALQPVVIRGKGKICLDENVKFGVTNSPFFYNTYAYLEARHENAIIKIGKNVNCNNSISITAEKSIIIKDDVLIGYNCQISDSNFHDLHPEKRLETDPKPERVTIENNVFIGNNVTILKGVTIGENTVIAAGSIVTKSFPSNVIIGGCPASVINALD